MSKRMIQFKAGAAEQLTLLAIELEKQQKLATTMTGEKERLEQRLNHLEKTLEDKTNECVFLSEESQVNGSQNEFPLNPMVFRFYIVLLGKQLKEHSLTSDGK